MSDEMSTPRHSVMRHCILTDTHSITSLADPGPTHQHFFFFISLFVLQSFISSGDYDDEDDYPDLNERLESYKSE